MLGLLKLLTFPVSGPLIGAQWIAGVLRDEAERQLYDVSDIQQRMAELEREYQSGAMDVRAFESQQEALLQRLLDARAYHRQKEAEAIGLEPAAPNTPAVAPPASTRRRRQPRGRRHQPRRSHGQLP
jgi:hypothetical protein